MMSVPTVLIIDDHRLIREMWSKALQSSGQVKVLVYSGQQTDAIDIISSQHPDIILLDINMTPLSGYEMMPLIKESAPASKVIALTMHANQTHAVKMMEAGASGYVTKNAELAEVLLAIQETYHGRQYIDPALRDHIKVA